MGLHTKTYKKTHRTPFHFKMHLLGPKWVKFEPERCILNRKCVKKRSKKNGGRFLLANQHWVSIAQCLGNGCPTLGC